MSMSTHVIGFRPADEHWQRMKTVWEACLQAAIEPPESVLEFFDHREPDPNGVEVEIKDVSVYEAEGERGIEIRVATIPEGVKVIRFYNSW